ncbi:MAG: type II toxin-antitoxin system RelE/ParE family toxin [Candidatus Binataceae bacterium]
MTAAVFHPLAERELVESAKFYELSAAGLGEDFIGQVERTLARIAANPEAGSPLTKTIRRQLVRRFPFAILYQPKPAGLFVVAVMHVRRRPGYWKGRLHAKQ